MNRKLLNIIKNLIIILVLVSIGILVLSTSSLAVVKKSEVPLAQIMKEKIAMWYSIIRTTCLGFMFIAIIFLCLKFLVFDRSPENLALFKTMFIHWIIGMILIYGIHFVMIGIVEINELGVSKAREIGAELSGLAEGDEANKEEYSLYDQALTQAYELNIIAGNVGMIMYIMFVFYTYKFTFVYAKRYINVIVLILISPIVFLVSTIKKGLQGRNAGLTKRWFKEFIYNVCIQTVHALFYATCIGLTINLSNNKETYVGAFLTLLVFAFIFKLDGFIRMIFNFVGGKAITVRKFDFWRTAGNVRRMVQDYKNGQGAVFEKKQQISGLMNSFENGFKDVNPEDVMNVVRNGSLKFKNVSHSAKNSIRDFGKTIDGKNVKLSAEEIVEEEEKMKNPNLLEKLLHSTRDMALAVGSAGVGIGLGIANITNSFATKVRNLIKKEIDELNLDVEMVKHIPKIIRAHQRKELPEPIENNPELTEVYQTVIDLGEDGKVLIVKIKDRVENGDKDVIAIIYNEVGPQAFLYPKVGSPFMGMKLLAEHKYEQKAVNQILGLTPEKRTITAPSVSSEAVSEKGKKADNEKDNYKSKHRVRIKSYKFNRFNPTATKNIVHKLEVHTILSDSYLKVMTNVYGKLKVGKLNARGNVGIKKTEIKYSAKTNLANAKKQQATLKLYAFGQRKEDGKWAMISSNIAERKMQIQNTLQAKLVKIKEMPAAQVAMNTLARMGKAFEIDKGVSLVVDDVTRRLVKPVAPIYKEVADKVNAVSEAIKDVYGTALEVKGIFGQNAEKSMVNIVPKQTLEEHPQAKKLQEVGIIKEESIVQFIMTDNGDVTQQILNLEGQVIEPAKDESGDIIAKRVDEAGQIIQHVVSMEGTIVEQKIDITDDNVAIVDAQAENKVVESEKSKDVINQISEVAFFVVSGNLTSISETVKGTDDIVSFTNELNKTAVNGEVNEKVTVEQGIGKLDTLLGQISQEEKEQAIADKVLVNAAISSGIYDIKHFNLEENADIKLQIIDDLIANGVIGNDIRNNEAAKRDIIDSMQVRAKELDGDVVLDAVAQKEYASIVSESIKSGEVTPDDVDKIDLESKLGNLSDVIEKAARETLDEVRFGKDLYADEAKKQRELEREKAEYRKKKGYTDDSNSSGEEESEIVKVTLKFSGAVSTQFIAVTLSNKDTISAFYDRAMPLPTANKSKTQDYFNRVYAGKLGGIYYSFDKYANEHMDGWEIHVVDDREDIDGDDSYQKEEGILTRANEREELERIINKNIPSLKKIIEKFIEDRNVTSLDTLRTNNKLKTDLVSKIARELRRENISRYQIMDLVERLDHYKEFRDIIAKAKSKNKEQAVKDRAKEAILKQKEKMSVVRTDEDLEVDEEEAQEDRKREMKIAESENNYEVSLDSMEVLQDMFESLNATKVLADKPTAKQEARQKMYMDFYENNSGKDQFPLS